jgi:hypothetical protein
LDAAAVGGRIFGTAASVRTCLMTALLPLLLVLSVPVATSLPPVAADPEALVVRVHYPQPIERVDTKLGTVPNLLVNREVSQRFKAMAPQLAWLRAQVPELDLDARLHEHLGCAFRVAGDCTGAVVVDGVGEEPALPTVPKRSLHVTFIGTNDGLNAQFVYMETNGADPTLLRGVRLWHEAPNCPGVNNDPLAAYDDRKPSRRTPPLAACWFAGTPSRFETMVDTVLAEFVSIVQWPGGELGPNDVPLTEYAWVMALPTVQSLEDAGISHCRGRQCDWPLIWHRDGRMAVIPKSPGGMPLILTKPVPPP